MTEKDLEKLKGIVAFRMFEFTNSVEVKTTGVGSCMEIKASSHKKKAQRFVILEAGMWTFNQAAQAVGRACTELKEELTY